MYGYDYTPATESVISWFKNLVSSVGRKVKEVAEFLRRHIIELGRKLKGNKADFAAHDGMAMQLIGRIGRSTEKLIIECSKTINTMWNDYGNFGELKKVKDDSRDTINFFTSDGDKGFDPTHGNMKRDKDVSEDAYNNFQETFGKLFTNMHADAEGIQKCLNDLEEISALSYKSTVEGYKQLKDLYDANGKFGKEWSQLKTAHEFADDGPIKKALGKIVTMYNVGVNAATTFAKRLITNKYRDENGKRYSVFSEQRKQAKNEYKNNGRVDAAKAIDKDAPDRGDRAYTDRGRFTDDEIAAKIAHKNADAEESVLLSRLYDIAYEDAMHDLEMRSQYIKAFESVPDAFETEI
jgi:hypothetical protein